MKPQQAIFTQTKHSDRNRRLMFFAVPVVMGLGGLFLAQQFREPLFRWTVLFISVALPLFASGSMLTRYRTSLAERFAMFLGVMLLILGAAFSISGIAIPGLQEFMGYESVDNLSHIIGGTSLILGLFVVLFSIFRSGEDTEAVAERFRMLADNISEGFILSHANGTIYLINDRISEMFARPKEEIIGHNIQELAEKFDLAPIRQHIETRAHGVASEYELNIRVDGQEKILMINGHPVLNSQRQHVATVATIRDMTDLVTLNRRVEQYAKGLQQLVEEQTKRLQASEERFRELLLTMNEGFLTIDMGHRVRFVNARMGDLLHIPGESLLNHDIFEFVEDSSRSRLLRLLTRAVKHSEKGLRQEIDFLDSDGRSVPTVVAAAFLPEGEEEEGGHSLVVTGIAEIKRMQQKLSVRARELERVNEELRMHDRAKDGFLSNVSHELRTPLSTIQGYIELFNTGAMGPLAEAQATALKVVERNVERLLGLINEMLEFSRMQIRGIQLVENIFRPELLANEAAAAVHPSALEKALEVVVDTQNAPEYVWADREKVTQVLGILLNNAVKFTGRGGRIHVYAGLENSADLILSVSDNGIGIDPSYHTKIFDRFFQVDSSKQRQYEGTGIGLSLAKNIVDAHGGTISVESTPGEGSTFIVRLPGSALDLPGETELPEEFGGLDDLRILIASEREETASGLAAMLGGSIRSLEWSTSGFQCVRRAAEGEVDLLVVNEASADVLGKTTMRLLRQNTATESVPAVILTTESESAIQEARALWPRTEYLVKPFTRDVFCECVRKLVAGADMEDAGEPVEMQMPVVQRRCVFVIDSDPGLLEWVAMALKYRDVGCYCTATVHAAVETAQNLQPDVILLDGDAAGPRVTDAVRILHESPVTASVPIYMMTGLGSSVFNGLDVTGVLRKPFSVNEIIDLIGAGRS